jgi:site-specific DNA-methyltransferase (adenine-specific)
MKEYLNITNECNLELMKRYEDNHFDLAIVDPPYGIGFDGQKENKATNRKAHDFKGWDNAIPSEEYFNELKRVSKNQIIWGGNYFFDYLGNTRCVLTWDKIQEFSGSDFELAWTSFDKCAKTFRMSRVQAYCNRTKIHPTQKPSELYEWILTRYAENNQKILDTHLGSGSIAIAVDKVNKLEKMNLTLTACELDEDYFKKAIKMIETETRQESLF